ncbi:MAG: D-alanyl-D-alanine carboxypeptidase family protein [Thermoleophilia bacterium]|jgi:D-alanyl-D-alanine carboxypeptidase (penicillin-binding protein 5/6)
MRTVCKWLGPVLVLAVISVILVSIASGVACGDTGTVPFTLADDLPAGQAGASTLDRSGETVEIFTVKADEEAGARPQPPSITSPSAIVIDAATGRVLYEQRAHVRRPMASTTKIMTAVLALENLPMDRQVTVSESAGWTYEPKPILRPGDVITIEQLLYALLVQSSNGAAVALAETLDGGVEAFAARMNAKAEQLGMADTHFVTPNGLDAAGHYSTAADMATVARYAMENARFSAIVDTSAYSLVLPGRSKPLELVNTNKLLTRDEWVTGIKTGDTPRAKRCLVGSATRDGVSVISVLLGQLSSETCWKESEGLLEYGLAQCRHVTLLQQGAVLAESQKPYRIDDPVRLVAQDTVEATVCRDDEVTVSVRIDRNPVLPVKDGESFGQVVLTVGGDEIGSVDIVADRSYTQTTLGTKVVYLCGRIVDWLGG